VIELFGRLGHPPSLPEISGATSLTPDQVRAHLAELQAHDLLGTDHVTGEIVFAYPFTSRVTEHRIKLDGSMLHALCAIDALGIGGMFQTDIAITSSCRLCQAPINIATANSGRVVSTNPTTRSCGMTWPTPRLQRRHAVRRSASSVPTATFNNGWLRRTHLAQGLG
jgi:hypothetical protein